MSFSYYNLFVGSETGLLKGINTKTKSFNNLNNLQNLTREKEIICMCWTNDSKQDQIYFATKDQHIIKYNSYHDQETPFTVLGNFDIGNGVIKGLESITDDKIVTCTDKGILKLWSIKDTDNDDENIFKNKSLNDLQVGSDIFTIKKNKFNSSLIATGGKENDLKIWDLNNLKKNLNEPIFRAKNVADNWMQLREPVWVMSIDFIDENRVAVGTGHHQIRVYDIKSSLRRPVYNLNYGEYPISSIAVVPDDSNRLIAANTRGDMEMIDLRSVTSKNEQCKTVKKYKGFVGTLKSIQVTKSDAFNYNGSNLCVAACGLDRFLRVYHLETSQIISRIYLKSRLNCCLFSKHEPMKPNSTKSVKEQDEDQLSVVNSEDLGTDDLWSDIETIVDENPGLILKKSKQKLSKRLEDFDSDLNQDEEEEDENEKDVHQEEDGFKKPKLPIKLKNNKKLKKKN